jgi:magnesium-transporting ATPase (P-type)
LGLNDISRILNLLISSVIFIYFVIIVTIYNYYIILGKTQIIAGKPHISNLSTNYITIQYE